MNNFTFKINYWAVVVAAVAAFIMSSIWYIGFGDVLVGLSSVYASTQAPSPWVILIEFLRSLVVAYILARFAMLFGITDWKDVMRFGAWMWIFPVFILLGSIIHEGYPFTLAAIHAGDWLVKLLLISFIIGVWRKK